VLDRHGRLVASGAAVALTALLVATQLVDRDTPALATGLAPGQSRDWSFANEQLTDAQVLVGSWQSDSQASICRVNLDNGEVPRPGSEKMGLLELAPMTTYGVDGQAFSVEAHYFEQRPAKVQGTQMDAGIAFGIRDESNFYVLEQSALHDILRLNRYVHARRRDVREKLARTHGNEWHTLKVSVRGDVVSASLGSQEIYSVNHLAETSGGIGMWARTSAATCFDEVHIRIGEGT
jgi:hypothetical protein